MPVPLRIAFVRQHALSTLAGYTGLDIDLPIPADRGAIHIDSPANRWAAVRACAGAGQATAADSCVTVADNMGDQASRV